MRISPLLLGLLMVSGVLAASCFSTPEPVPTLTENTEWPSLEDNRDLVLVQPLHGRDLRLAYLTTAQVWHIRDWMHAEYGGPDAFNNTWAPDGKRFVFLASSDSGVAIQLVDLVAQSVRVLYESGGLYGAQKLYWSHDGRYVLFTEQIETHPYLDRLRLLDIASGESRIVYTQNTQSINGGGTRSSVPHLQLFGWSKDDRWIGFVSIENLRFDVTLLNTATSQVVSLPEDDGMRQVQWSSTSDQLLIGYASFNPLSVGAPFPSIEDLLIVETDNFQTLAAVDRAGTFSRAPAWTNDGSRVAYWTDSKTVCITTMPTGEETCPFVQLPSGTQWAVISDEFPPMSWSNDGSYLTFAVIEDGTRPMGYLVDSSGNLVVRSEALYGYVYWPPNPISLSPE